MSKRRSVRGGSNDETCDPQMAATFPSLPFGAKIHGSTVPLGASKFTAFDNMLVRHSLRFVGVVVAPWYDQGITRDIEMQIRRVTREHNGCFGHCLGDYHCEYGNSRHLGHTENLS